MKGQTILIILLIVTIILTVGLSIISSSITDIKISQQTEEASRAFYVAESALEESLLHPFLAETVVTGNIGGIDYKVEKSKKEGENFLFPFLLENGDPQIVWLVGHNEQGELDLGTNYSGPVSFYWGKTSSDEKPALAVSYIYKENETSKIARYNFDPDNTRRSQNSFGPAETGSYSVEEENLKYFASVSNLPSGLNIQPYFLKLTLFYNTSPQPLAIKATATPYLPNQGFCFISAATVAESGITKRIKQCKLWENIPTVFQWGLFSGGDLQK